MARTTFVLGLVCAIAGCGKKEPVRDSTVSSAGPSPSSAPISAAVTAPSATAEAPKAAALVAAPVSAEAPASFAGGAKENIEGAVGQGCEARSSQGWLEFLCRKKNGTGGHPVRATWKVEGSEDADADQEVLADEQRELKLVLPFSGEASRDVTIEWSDTRYVLHVNGPTGKLEWAAAGLDLRRACAHVQDESKARVTEAQKAPAPAGLSAAEAAKLPRFGVCQAAGFGSYALGLKSISAEGEGSARKLTASLEVIFVAENGARKSAEFGRFSFAPGGLSFAPLRVYDYDDDGKDELIVPYELSAPAATSDDAVPAAIWSLTDASIVPYAKSPSVGQGGLGVEQLDFDMRPDLSDYGPYVALLPSNCGVKSCPARVTGPRFFFHSLADGGFSRDDAAAKAALKRACPKKPEALLVDSAGSLNLAQSAKNIACALAWGSTPSAVNAELAQKRALVCGDAESCPLLSAFEKWAAAAPPALIGP